MHGARDNQLIQFGSTADEYECSGMVTTLMPAGGGYYYG